MKLFYYNVLTLILSLKCDSLRHKYLSKCQHMKGRFMISAEVRIGRFFVKLPKYNKVNNLLWFQDSCHAILFSLTKTASRSLNSVNIIEIAPFGSNFNDGNYIQGINKADLLSSRGLATWVEILIFGMQKYVSKLDFAR